MGSKITSGRGKKGDGLHIDKDTKQRTYGVARCIYSFTKGQLEALLANANTRNKDIGKIKREIRKREYCRDIQVI